MASGERVETGRLATICGAVLAGGASVCTGRDEPRSALAGRPTVARAARLLATLFEEVLLVGGSPPEEVPGRRVVDLEGPTCALRGLASALAASRAERVLVLAGDLPRVTPDLLLALVAWPEADAVAPRTRHGSHPLCALYRREAVLPVARARLAAGRLALHDLLGALETAYLDESDLAHVDPAGLALTKVHSSES